MGNIFPVQMSCETLPARCWDYAGRQVAYVCQIEGNLEALQTARDQLWAKKYDVDLEVRDARFEGMKPLQEVENWLSKVESKLVEVDNLIQAGPEEKKRLCFGGCFSNNYRSSYIFGKSVARRLLDVATLRQEGGFKEVAKWPHADPQYIRQLEEKVEALRARGRELRECNAIIKLRLASEETQRRKSLQSVQVWLSSVEATMAEVDSLITSGQEQIERLRATGSSSYTYWKNFDKVLDDVAALIKDGDFKTLTDTPFAVVDPVLERPSEQTVGLEVTMAQVWDWIMEANFGIIGIYGMGGVGKTTLLTQINNKFDGSQNQFDLVIWIVVSKDLRMAKLLDELGKRVGVPSEEWSSKTPDEKAGDIFNALRRKKFILLLDDLWERVNLVRLGIPPLKARSGSKVVFTTRSEIVCSQMDAQRRIKMEPLPWDKAWELFQEKVGVETLNSHEDIPPLARAVARECDGLPLALITTARAMTCRNTPEEWKCALEDLKTCALNIFPGLGNEVYPLLKFSYDRLPDDRVRSCFLYCALFPEDFRISKDELTEYWACEDFWDEDDKGDRARNNGYHIIGTLVGACLLDSEDKHVKMHDVLRDMALWISRKFEKAKKNCLVEAGAQLTKVPEMARWEGIRRASLMENLFQNILEVPTCPDLLTLFLCRSPQLQGITSGFFQSMHALMVLDLSHTGVKVLPKDMWDLLTLQYLNLSCTCIERIPLDMKRLKKLKHLNLEHNTLLAVIPRSVISSLLRLQVLKMRGCAFFVEEAKDNVLCDSDILVDELQCLEEPYKLSLTIGSPSALQRFLCADHLPRSTEALSFECFSGSKSINISLLASNMHTFHISTSNDLEELVVNDFPPNLQRPAMLNESICFKKLTEVNVEYCFRLHDLTWLLLAPNLKALKVAVCERMREIISMDKLGEAYYVNRRDLSLFTKLEVLVLEDLPKLTSIHPNSLSFPLLRKVRVVDCPMLKKLPLNSDSCNGCKVVIEAEDHWWKDVKWENAATRNVFMSSFMSCNSRKRVHRPSYLCDPWKL